MCDSSGVVFCVLCAVLSIKYTEVGVGRSGLEGSVVWVVAAPSC